jgi:GTPase involved in cell partitioning and DNA repair
VFVYDVSEPASFKKTFEVLKLILEAEKNQLRGRNEEKHIVPFKMMMGNKMDLLGKFAVKDLEELMKEQIDHKVVSAFTNEGVSEAFEALLNAIAPPKKAQVEQEDEEARDK